MASEGLTRRAFGAIGAAALVTRPLFAQTAPAFRLGLTPVFLDNDAAIHARAKALGYVA